MKKFKNRIAKFAIPFENKQWGFRYGAAEITRLTSDEADGSVTLSLETPKHPRIQIRVTRTGQVRFGTQEGSWTPGKEKTTPEITTPEITILQAMERLKKAMVEDKDYAFGWHSNIVMAVYDRVDNVSLEDANEAAANFMRLAFEVETSQDMPTATAMAAEADAAEAREAEVVRDV